MNNLQVIKAQLIKFANQDLALARKTGAVAVTQTKLGNIEIQYENGVYTAYAMLNGDVLAQGKAQVARDLLVSIYDVVGS
jgi:hypothetical protein